MTEVVYREIGQLVKKARLGARITQEVMAQRIGVKRSVLASHEVGRVRMPVHRLCDIAEVLGVSWRSLVPRQSRSRFWVPPIGWMGTANNVPWLAAPLQQGEEE